MSDTSQTPPVSAFRRFKRSPFAKFEFVAGATLTCVLTLLVVFSGILFPGGGTEVNLLARLSEPFQSGAHPLAPIRWAAIFWPGSFTVGASR